MWKFIRGKGQQPLAERQKLQKELFGYKKVSATICFSNVLKQLFVFFFAFRDYLEKFGFISTDDTILGHLSKSVISFVQ